MTVRIKKQRMDFFMILADYIAIGAVVLFALIGLGVGFGRFLEVLSDGIIGKIISVVVCYFLFGIVLNWEIVQNLLAQFVAFLQEQDNFLCNLLLQIRIDLVVFAIVLFIVVQIIRKLAVSVICNIFEADFLLMRIVNKLLGFALAIVTLVIVVLIVLQILTYCGSETVEQITSFLSGSALKLDKLFIENPLHSVLESINLGK